MKRNFVKMIGGTILALIVISGLTFGVVSAQDESKNGTSGGARFEGTWDVQVTVRNCPNGAVIRVFPAIATFVSGGTMQLTEAGTAPALKSPGQGVWSHTDGNSYRFKSKAFNFDATGNYSGWMTITNEANLNTRADEFESAGVAKVYTPNGNLVFTGCSTLAATRFE